MQVGLQDTAGNIGKIYTLLLDSTGSAIDQVSAIPQGNGVFDYSFTNVAPGIYRIIAGSDIDNDRFICQLAEACGGYPTINALSTIEVINRNISGFDFIVDILSNFGTSNLSLDASQTTGGFHREAINSKQINP